MVLKPRGVVFFSATSPKIQTRTHLTQITLTHFTLPHTSHSLSLFKRTPVLTLTRRKPHATPLQVSNPHRSSQHSHPPTLVLTVSHSSNPNILKTHTSPHSHSNVVPHHYESQTHTRPHNKSLTLKPTPVLTVSHFSNLNTVKPKHQSLVSHSSNLAPTDLITLQTLSLKPHFVPLLNLITLQIGLNLNLKVGTLSQSTCFD